jgi:hypothetical protein
MLKVLCVSGLMMIGDLTIPIEHINYFQYREGQSELKIVLNDKEWFLRSPVDYQQVRTEWQKCRSAFAWSNS